MPMTLPLCPDLVVLFFGTSARAKGLYASERVGCEKKQVLRNSLKLKLSRRCSWERKQVELDKQLGLQSHVEHRSPVSDPL